VWNGLNVRSRSWAFGSFGRVARGDIALRRPGDLRSGGAAMGAGASRLPQGGVEWSECAESELGFWVVWARGVW